MRNAHNTNPPKFPPGPVDGAVLERAFSIFQRQLVAQMDPRYANNDFNQGIVADGAGGVTLGVKSFPQGRVAALPALTTNISDTGRAVSQRFLTPLMSGNRQSVQNSSAILSSTSTATVGSVSVAAHSVRYDFGTLPYSSGSITGLTPNTSYLVYADDQEYAGGAVTYLATTNPDIVISPGRYYVGGVTTGVAATTQAIASADTGNPVGFTTTSNHGWNTNDQVIFASLPGSYAALNDVTKVITVTGLTTFTVATDATTFTGTFPAGNATRVSVASMGGGGAGAGSITGRWSGYNFS